MKPINLTLSILTFLFYSTAIVLANDTVAVIFKTCTGDTSVFKVENVSLSCGDDPCTWGADATVSGNYTFGDEVATETPIVHASFWGLTLFNDTVDICDDGTVTNSDGDVCPSIGTYEYYSDTKLPGFSLLSWLTSWFNIVVSTTFDFGNAEVVCKVQVKGNRSSSSSSAMIVGSVALGSVFVIFRMRTRRIVAATEVEHETSSDYEPATHFVEMAPRRSVTEGVYV
jgi:hypothetical protein